MQHGGLTGCRHHLLPHEGDCTACLARTGRPPTAVHIRLQRQGRKGQRIEPEPLRSLSTPRCQQVAAARASPWHIQVRHSLQHLQRSPRPCPASWHLNKPAPVPWTALAMVNLSIEAVQQAAWHLQCSAQLQHTLGYSNKPTCARPKHCTPWPWPKACSRHRPSHLCCAGSECRQVGCARGRADQAGKLHASASQRLCCAQECEHPAARALSVRMLQSVVLHVTTTCI